MGTVIDQDGIRLVIHTRGEDRHKLPHVHVKGRGCEVVFSLIDFQQLTDTDFSPGDMRRVLKMVKFYQSELLEVWNEYHEET